MQCFAFLFTTGVRLGLSVTCNVFFVQQVDFRDKLYLAPLTTVSLFAFHKGHNLGA